jgi:DNA-binding NarL/FixJ family response regulator
MQVLIIDNSLLIVERLKEFLSESTNISVLLSASSYEEALQLFMLHRPGIVVLDHHLPENKSYQLLREVKEVALKTLVILLSIENDDYTLQQCTILGADFFFDKYNEFEKIAVVINDFNIQMKSVKNEK